MSQQVKIAWNQIIDYLKKDFEDINFYEKYVKNIEIFKIQNKRIFFICPNFVVKNLFSITFKKKIEQKFLDLLNLSFECFFFLKEEEIELPESTQKKSDFLDSTLTFESYIIGGFNSEIASIKDHIKSEINDFSPIFIYGKTGLGKTHAINAIGNEIKKHNFDKKLLFLNTEEFLNDAYKAISNKSVESYKEEFMNVDVLIVDDIQFLSNKPTLNQIFFSVFNKLFKDKKIIILASDKFPNNLEIDQRMISRFQSGITINIKKPDELSLKKIVNSYELKYGFNLSNDAISFLLNRFNNDIRLLIGVIKKIVLNVDRKEIVTRKKMESILSDEINLGLINTGYSVSPEIIIQNVAMHYQISSQEIISKSRKQNIKNARGLCIYIIKNKLNISYAEIGSIFSNRSHSTIIEAYKMLETQMEKNQDFTIFVDNLIKKI